jgi:small subunit ribosomal protein S9
MKKTNLKKKTEKKKTKTRKKSTPKRIAKKIQKKEEIKKPSCITAIGRRKTSTARVKIFFETEDKKEILINKKAFKVYFSEPELEKIILSPFKKTNFLNKIRVEVLVKGGGKRGQAEASRLGFSRALLKIDSNLKEILRSAGYLTRDPRKKERKKFGLKKARKAPQWQKR